MKTQRRKITIRTLAARKRKGIPITMVTAYDATMARLMDAAGVDAILIGDSLGMVVQGHEHTLEVTLEHMIYHTSCVARATKFAHVVADMPFGSYHVSPQQAVTSAIRLIKEGSAEAVKLEGGAERVDAIRAITEAQIPVMGHVGLTPQSVHRIGGFRIQGRTDKAADRVFEDALAVAEAGVYSIVLESIPHDLAERISNAVSVPTIGIGAGSRCDGQVLVCYDMLGFDEAFEPRFLKKFARLGPQIVSAVQAYGDEVRERSFPTLEHSFEGLQSEKPGEKNQAEGAQESAEGEGDQTALYNSGKSA